MRKTWKIPTDRGTREGMRFKLLQQRVHEIISSSLQNDPELKTLGIFLCTKLKVYFQAKGHEKYQLIEEREQGCSRTGRDLSLLFISLSSSRHTHFAQADEQLHPS